jgi:predicted GNAT family acetyltransferase
MPEPDAVVRRNGERSRYELVAGDSVIGFAEFHDDGRALVFPHTVIAPEHRGRGNGEVLVRAALDDVRARGRTIVPTCWFVREFVDLNPDYADLLHQP